MTLPLGQTRTHVARDHAFLAPDGHVVAPLPGWTNTQGVILVSPAMGAGFCQYIAMMGKSSAAAMVPDDVQRFVFVREGEATLEVDGETTTLRPESYAYLPAGAEHDLTCNQSATLFVFEYIYEALDDVDPPQTIIGHVNDCAAEPFMGDPDAMLAPLLPSDAGFDLAVNLFTFKPGAALPLVETHVFEHGLFMTKGQGVYRLADRWYPIQESDAIWMGPYCPQWFCAIGKQPAQYLYSKNINRDALA